ncbi:MAG: hypothetical protein RLZZ447_1928 [Verrucomicrobiota bacterium]
MVLRGIHVYPVKSLGGCAVQEAEVDALGLVGDRRFLVVDSEGRFLTQRTLPRMALIATQLDAATLTLTAAGAGSVAVSRAPDPAAPLVAVTVWKSEGLLAEDCGAAAAEWLGRFLGVAWRLVRIGPAFRRPVRRVPGELAATPLVGFADAYPFLLASEASRADLNDRLVAGGEEPLPWDRFRANLIIEGCAAFAEDTWPRVRIGAIDFLAAGPCARCAVTTTDQLTGERGVEPLRTLATYRRDPRVPEDVNFGQNLIHLTVGGRLRVGDAVCSLAAAGSDPNPGSGLG